jgi:hypothetical protein
MQLNQVATGNRPKLAARIFLGSILCAIAAQAVPPPSGIAPVISPTGGFAIDGNLMANSPVTNVGDWLLSTNAGTGGAVLDATGAPLNATTTFHFKDSYNSTADNTFSGGKWTDDPGTWQWTPGKANSKTDINNVLLH